MSSRSKRHRRSPAASSVATVGAEKSACPGVQPYESEPPAACDRSLPTHEEVAVRAREIWEQRGCPQGQDYEVWLAAEGELFGRNG